MLYEVITRQVVGHDRIVGILRIEHFVDLDRPLDIALPLARAGLLGQVGLAEAANPITFGNAIRITSYNVCYTKLLRFAPVYLLNIKY